MSKENKNKDSTDSTDKIDEIITINDFKSMLIGMDLILGDQWTPDENQWKRIRKKIDVLIETHERSGGVASAVPPLVGPSSHLPVDSNLNISDAELLRSFPSVPVVTAIPIGELEPTSSALTPTPADNNGPIKTPDIDSSAGYKSEFV